MGHLPAIRCIDEATAELMRVLEGSVSAEERSNAICQLARRGTADAGRVLIDAYGRCIEPETREQLLLAIADVRHERTLEFLLRLATQREEPLAARWALRALGRTAHALAGEFLGSLLWLGETAFSRDAIESLCVLQGYPSGPVLAAALDGAVERGAWGLVPLLISAVAQRGTCSQWPSVERAVHHPSMTSAVCAAAIPAAGLLGGSRARAWLAACPLPEEHSAALATAHAVGVAREASSPAVLVELLARAQDERAQSAIVQALADRADGTPAALRPEVWDAVMALPTTKQAAVRTALVAPERLAEDAGWMGSLDASDADAAACVLVAHREAAPWAHLSWVPRWQPALAIAVWKRVRDPLAPGCLLEWAASERLPLTCRVDAVNALVCQAQAEPAHTAHRAAATAALLDLERQDLPSRLAGRVIRAIGQVDAAPPALLEQWSDELARPGAAEGRRSSIYYALSLMRSPEAAERLSGEVARLGRGACTPELEHALVALAHSGSVPRAGALEHVVVPPSRRARWALLRILGRARVAGHSELIQTALESTEWAETLLGVAAAGPNFEPSMREKLLALLNDPELALAQRSRDVLCTHTDRAIVDALLVHLERANAHRADALEVLRSLDPAAMSDPVGLAATVAGCIARGRGAFADAEVRAVAERLRAALAPSPGGPPPHSLDDEALPGFALLPETALAVVRNAELTFRRHDLFDESVDKSTATVEYVKAIDLLLQEHLGRAMFEAPRRSGGDTLLDRMRSRAVALGLDDDSIPAGVVLDALDCRSHFDEETFPAYKLAAICRALVKNRIERAPYRHVDGLRAWAALLLVFGRNFDCRGENIETILPIRNVPGLRICALAARLNALQELRNHSAHRGTLLVRDELLATRQDSLGVLSELAAVLDVAASA